MREIKILAHVSKLINELQLLVYIYVEAPVKFKVRFELQVLVPKLRYYTPLLDPRLYLPEVRTENRIGKWFFELLVGHPHVN